MNKKCRTHLPDNFLIIFRKERTTPYTNFASSSNGNPADDCSGGGGGAFCIIERGADSSFTAITTPLVDDSVLRGLGVATLFASLNWVTARETPGSMPPSTAGFGRLVRCQSW